MARLAKLREQLQETLWPAPVLGLLLAVALAVASLNLDDEIAAGGSAVIGFAGGADSARSILSTIAASMLTFLALVFTLTVIALQLATDFSPRLLRTFLTAGISKLALAVFVGTFSYAVLVLREVTSTNVPELSVTVALVLVILSVIVFVYYVSSIAQSLRVANIVKRSGDETRAEIERAFPPGERPGAESEERSAGRSEVEDLAISGELVWTGPPGIALAIDMQGVCRLAAEHEAMVELRFEVGDFLPEGALLGVVRAAEREIDSAALGGLVAVAPERTLRQDAAFGLRQLADVGARALSPGVNDPTTAIQALDQIHDLLLRIGSRKLYPGVLRDSEGAVRVLAPVHDWDDYLRLAVEEIRLYGEGSPQVARRLRALLEDLRERLDPCRRDAIDEQLELLDRSVERGFEDEADRRRARLTPAAAGGGGESSPD